MGEDALLALRVLVSLGAVVGLLWFVGRRVARGVQPTAEADVRVVGRQSLARRSGVVVLAVGTRRLLLGYGDQEVRLLAELDEVAAPAPGDVPDPATGTGDGTALPWRSALRALQERTVRR